MSVLLWWLPAVVVVAIVWWRGRPRRRGLSDKDLDTMARVLDARR